MPQFAVFFFDGAGFGIEVVQALDADHAQDITRAQHPKGRLSAVPAELLDGQDRHKLLAASVRGRGEPFLLADFHPPPLLVEFPAAPPPPPFRHPERPRHNRCRTGPHRCRCR